MKKKNLEIPAYMRPTLENHEKEMKKADQLTTLAEKYYNGKPWHPVGVTQVFKATCKRAGMEILSPHVMRHTFASRLIMAEVDLRTVQELMGHKSIAMTIRYAHLSPDHKRAAISALENRLSEKSPIPAHNIPHPVPSAPHAKVTAIR